MDKVRIRAEWLIQKPLRKAKLHKMAGAGYKPAPACLKNKQRKLCEKHNKRRNSHG
jgi:hypothetical protein